MKGITLWKVLLLDKNQVINKLFNVLTWTVPNTLWKYSRGAVLWLVAQSRPTLYDTMECTTFGVRCRTNTARLLCRWGFSRQEYWSGLPCPPPGDLSTPGMKPRFPALQADSLYHPSHQGSPRVLEWVAYAPPPADLPNPGIEPGSPALHMDSLPAELPGKPTAEV